MAINSALRLDLLRKLMRDRGMVKPGTGEPSPGALAVKIDRKINQCSDLLKGRASFGEDIARHIEECFGLPMWHLDGGAGWPFPNIERERFDRLEQWQQIEIQAKVRDAIERFEGSQDGPRRGVSLAASNSPEGRLPGDDPNVIEVKAKPAAKRAGRQK